MSVLEIQHEGNSQLTRLTEAFFARLNELGRSQIQNGKTHYSDLNVGECPKFLCLNILLSMVLFWPSHEGPSLTSGIDTR